MIRLTVTYPHAPGATFDHEYYRSKHVPLCLRTWGLEDAEIDRGIEGPSLAAVHFRFNSVEDYRSAMSGEGQADIVADFPNYTTVTPVLQVSEIVDPA